MKTIPREGPFYEMAVNGLGFKNLDNKLKKYMTNTMKKLHLQIILCLN